MTGRDNSLIKRVIKPPTKLAPMVAAGEVRVFVSGLERLGYDRAMLLAAAGFVPAARGPRDAVPFFLTAS